MLTKFIQRIVQVAEAYWKPLVLLGVAAAIGSATAMRMNSAEDATQALSRVYDSSPHYEYRLVPSSRPTK